MNVPTLKFLYLNHRDETSERHVRPLGRVWYGETDWYEGMHWYIHCYDLEKNADRDFRLDRMTDITPSSATRNMDDPHEHRTG